jgi:peptidoglycan/LPS O-acetylase OafA/YrhL
VTAWSPRFWLAKVLSWSPLVLLGEISYELYLSHFLVFRAVSRLGLGVRFEWAHGVACFLGAVVVAYLLHKGFSRPTQRAIRDWAKRAFGRATAAGVPAVDAGGMSR